MTDLKAVRVILWGKTVGALSWDKGSYCGHFQYAPAFAASGLEVSPIVMPLSLGVYRFPELSQSETFLGLPGLLADSLPDRYGNALMAKWLSRRGLLFSDLSPAERLCYLGRRGMGALEFEPDYDPAAQEPFSVEVHELVDLAREIMKRHDESVVELGDTPSLQKLIQVGTSAGGAKAKAIIAVNDSTGQIMSGQGQSQKGFDHWILKFSEVENSEHAADRDVGRLEYAYYLMALEAGIGMMESRLLPDGNRAHFMTRRFDRPQGKKIHVQTYCALAHADRNPPGNTHYEALFATARRLGLGQQSLDELYRRMVFNILARNQDDHAKNHSFMMDSTGEWRLSPAYDIVFMYKKGSLWVDKQQMCCNGKRDFFTRADLLSAAQAADIKDPEKIIRQVQAALAVWPDCADKAGLNEDQTKTVQDFFRALD